MKESLLSDDLILLDYDAVDREELLKELAEVLRQKGYVKESFAQAIMEREKIFPTGLNTPEVRIAMPHTAPAHVNHPAILVAKLKNSIQFKEMGGSGKNVEANLIFMLAVTNPKGHLETLSKLMDIFSDGKKLMNLYQSATKKELIDQLKKILA